MNIKFHKTEIKKLTEEFKRKIEYHKNKIKNIKDYEALSPIEKLLHWIEKEHVLYRDDIIIMMLKFKVDHVFISAFREHTMYRWYGSEVIKEVEKVKALHGI